MTGRSTATIWRQISVIELGHLTDDAISSPLPCIGTLISAFTVLCGAHSELIPERGVCCVFWLNVAAAMIQILTAVIMVGWIMSIFWGMDMVILASQLIH